MQDAYAAQIVEALMSIAKHLQQISFELNQIKTAQAAQARRP